MIWYYGYVVLPIGIYRSFLLSLLQRIVGGLLLEIDFDLSGCEFAVGSSNGCHSVLQEVLVSLVKSDLGES